MIKRFLAPALAIAAALFIVRSSAANAQDEVVELRLDARIERQLAPDQTHAFRITLPSDQYMFASVEQLGMDVVVRVHDPGGRVVDEIDRSGERGTEFVTLFSDTSGEYRIEITPFDAQAEPGGYAITVLRLEPVAGTMSGRVDQLFAPWDAPGSPGAALAVARDGEIVYEQGYGLAQLEYEIPITPTTVFHVASVSKQFTAFAVAMLADQGKLSLDDDIRTHLPEVPDFGDTITIRHLIHHTSGLRDQWVLLAMAGWRLDDVITRDQIMRLVRRQRELNFTPGDEYLYCNTGYTLLAEIVERVTGQSFAEWTADNIFRPLGMTDTHFHDDHELVVPNRAYSYARRDNGYRKAVLSYANVGATSLFTTVRDLVKWEKNLSDGKVGGPAVIEAMHRRGILNNGDTLSYAFGLGIGEYRGLRTVGHSGSDAGYRSYVTRFPEEDFIVVVLSNLGDFSSSSMARRVADVYLADRLQDEEPEPAIEPESEPPAVEVDPAIYDDYAGDYQIGTEVVKVFREGDRLWTQGADGPRLELVPESETRFLVPDRDVYVTFERDEAGEVYRFIASEGDETVEAHRIEPFAPEQVGLEEYTGEYYSEELGATYTLVVRDDSLVATHVRHDPIPLTPSAPDAFSGDTWFFREVEFERDADGSITGFRVTSGRVRGLLFIRS
ncbi:MAG: serine hydrolase [Gemmatimonadetes bacterium]|nr:serine hydrolase [Gemmatimonadota bacterium]NIO31963.1 serine hydrolase [Gemmatimonadota bacterium]